MCSRLIPQTVILAAGCALLVGVAGGLRADDKDRLTTERIIAPRIFKDKDKAKVKEAAEALRKLPSVKLVPHSDATPHFLVEFDPGKADLGELAKAIASVKTAGAKDDPAAFLMVRGKFGKGEQEGIIKALAKVKGVDAKRSEVDGERLLIALDDGGGAKLSEVVEAVKSAVPKK